MLVNVHQSGVIGSGSVSRAQICPRLGRNRSSCRAIACFVPSERRGPHVCPGTRSLRRGTPEERKVKIVMGVPQRSSKDTSGKAHAKGVHGCCQRAPEEGGKLIFSNFWRQHLIDFFSSDPLQNSLDSDSARRAKHFGGSLLNLDQEKSGSHAERFSVTGPPVVEPAAYLTSCGWDGQC